MSALSTMQNHLRELMAIHQRYLDEDGPDHPAVARLAARIQECRDGIEAILAAS